MSFDIRKAKEAPTKASAPAQQPAAEEDPGLAFIKQNRHLFGPFKAGSVLQATAGGYQLADVPEQYKAEIDKEARAERAAAEIGPDTVLPQPAQPLKVPQPVDFNSLPVEKQQAILEGQEEAMQKLRGLPGKAVGTPVAPSKPAQVKEPDKPKDLNPGLPPDIQLDINLVEFMERDRRSTEEAAKAAPEEAEAKKDAVPSAGGLGEKTHCQHCGWDLNKSDPWPPGELDKLNFIQSVLGQIPFKKTYELLGGRIEVTFRTLSSEESDMTFTQVAYDAGRGDILDEGQYFRTLTDYRLALGLSGFKTMDGVALTLPESLKEWETDKVPPKATKLTYIVPWLYEHVLKSESVRRAVAACFFRFQRMVENMEVHLDDSDFWPAIEKQS